MNKKRFFSCMLLLLLCTCLLGVTASAATEVTSKDDTFLLTPGSYTTGKEIPGDLLALSMELHVEKPVGGSIRAVATELYMNSKVERNVTVAGTYVEAGELFDAHDAVIIGTQVTFLGSCDSLSVTGSTVIIGGQIKGTLTVNADQVILLESAVFDSATISSRNQPKVVNDIHASAYTSLSDSAFAEKVQFTKLRSAFLENLSMLPLQVAGCVLLALLLMLAFRKGLETVSVQMNTRPAAFLLKGLLALFVLPIIGIVTIPFLPVGILLLLVFAILIICAQAITACLLARLWLAGKNAYLSTALLACGITVLSVIPYLGSIVTFVCVLVSLGLLPAILFRKKQPEPEMDFRV